MTAYLVTGCAGFIGSKVSELLLAGGHEVVGIDSLNDAYDTRLKDWRLARLQGHPQFSFSQIDICDRNALTRVVEEHEREQTHFSAILNLAARAGVRQSVEEPHVYIETNVVGTLNLLDMCRFFAIPKFILASTSSLYGQNTEMPFREDQDTSRPLSPYAASKKAAEALCYSYHHLYDIDITINRYFTVYGPAGRPDMSLFRFVQWIYEERPVTIFGDGNQSRDFTYVDDIAAGTIAGLCPVGFQVFNLGSDQPEKLIAVIRMIERAIGKPASLVFRPVQAADVSATWADITRAREILGWSPQWDLSRGVNKLVEWYAENREWARDIHTA